MAILLERGGAGPRLNHEFTGRVVGQGSYMNGRRMNE
jgi:hypothetical protein